MTYQETHQEQIMQTEEKNMKYTLENLPSSSCRTLLFPIAKAWKTEKAETRGNQNSGKALK